MVEEEEIGGGWRACARGREGERAGGRAGGRPEKDTAGDRRAVGQRLGRRGEGQLPPSRPVGQPGIKNRLFLRLSPLSPPSQWAAARNGSARVEAWSTHDDALPAWEPPPPRRAAHEPCVPGWSAACPGPLRPFPLAAVIGRQRCRSASRLNFRSQKRVQPPRPSRYTRRRNARAPQDAAQGWRSRPGTVTRGQ